MTYVLVGGRKREDVLEDAKRKIEESARDPSLSGTIDSSPGTPGFSINDIGDSWCIKGVHHEGSIYEIDHAKEVFRGSNEEVVEQTQNQWISFALKRGLTKTSSSLMFSPKSICLYATIWETLRRNAHHPLYGERIEEARNGIRKTIQENSIITLDQIVYNPRGKMDEILQDVGQPTQTIKGANFHGPGGNLETIPDGETIARLLFEYTLQDLDRLTMWLFGQKTHIIRYATKDDRQRKAIVDFSVNELYTNVDCVNTPDTPPRAALGIRVIDIKPYGEAK